MTWEIWVLSNDERRDVLEILEFDDDYDAATVKYAELQKDVEARGGCFELRRDGVYVSLYACTPPVGVKTD